MAPVSGAACVMGLIAAIVITLSVLASLFKLQCFVFVACRAVSQHLQSFLLVINLLLSTVLICQQILYWLVACDGCFL